MNDIASTFARVIDSRHCTTPLDSLKRAVISFLVVTGIATAGQPGDVSPYSQWDGNLLNTRFGDVSITANDLTAAWKTIGRKYLLRANLFINPTYDSDSARFDFRKQDATGKELLDAFCATYSAYIYTQDQETGILWIHPKSIKYQDILAQKVKVNRSASQILMLTDVLNPLCEVLSPNVAVIKHRGFNSGPPESRIFDYGLDVQSGNYTARELLNVCCVWNISKSFAIHVGPDGQVEIEPTNLYYGNPLYPRAAAVRFYEVECGKPAADIPSVAEVNTAMGDKNPRMRWAARNYLEAASEHYPLGVLITNCASSEKAMWTALGSKAVDFRGMNAKQFISRLPGLATNLTQIRTPTLALVMSLELAKEGQPLKYLDDIVSGHKYSEAEIASIEPDIYRLCRESKLALNKVKAMKLDVREFSPGALRELENTNIVMLVSQEKK